MNIECDLQEKESEGEIVWHAIPDVLSGSVLSKSSENTALTPEDQSINQLLLGFQKESKADFVPP